MNPKLLISKKYFCFILLFFSVTFHLAATAITQKQDCLILLDRDHYENVGSQTYFLMSRLQSAIEEQSTPLLLNSGLWNAFIERRTHFEQSLQKKESSLYKIHELYQTINESLKYWSDHYNDINSDVVQNKSLTVQRINQEFYKPQNYVSEANYQMLLNYSTHFNPQDWDIYKNNGGFYLFVPKKYSAQYSLKGFKVNSLQKLDNPEDSPHAYFETAIHKSIFDTLSDFFVTYQDLPETKMPYKWNILLAGHGGGKYRETKINKKINCVGQPIIADLTREEFNHLLAFCQSEINTHLFHYSSCYAGGHHIPLIFKNSQKKPFNFAITCDTLTDCASYCKWRVLLPSNEKKIFDNCRFVL